jgi:PDZ domain-containing protein
VLAVAVVVLALGVYAWETPSGDYAIWPDTAHPTAQYVLVPHGKPPAPGTGFYFVDVRIIDANLLTKFWAEHLVNGGGVLPIAEVRAPGQSNEQYTQQDLQQMATSQQVAQAVAERALHLPVRFAGTGVIVASVDPGLPAARAHVQPGWVIASVDGRRVRSAGGLLAITHGIRPGQIVRYVFAGHPPMALRTVANPSNRRQAIIGITIAETVRITRIPIHVRFLTQGIGGPSAGLAFALDIYDALSGRRLLRGHRIAVTGELSLDGTVSPIGGVVQKTIGAIDAGDDTFLVPAGQNYHDAVREAHGRIRVIAVTSFDQALRVIRALAPRG